MGSIGGSKDWLSGRDTPSRTEPLPDYEDWLMELIISCGVNSPIDASVRQMREYKYNGAAIALGHMKTHFAVATEKQWFIVTDKAKRYVELMDKEITL